MFSALYALQLYANVRIVAKVHRRVLHALSVDGTKSCQETAFGTKSFHDGMIDARGRQIYAHVFSALYALQERIVAKAHRRVLHAHSV